MKDCLTFFFLADPIVYSNLTFHEIHSITGKDYLLQANPCSLKELVEFWLQHICRMMIDTEEESARHTGGLEP